jgi:hypothetical protein
MFCVILREYPVINPAVKLRWFEKHWPERVHEIKDLFLHEVRSMLIKYLVF